MTTGFVWYTYFIDLPGKNGRAGISYAIEVNVKRRIVFSTLFVYKMFDYVFSSIG